MLISLAWLRKYVQVGDDTAALVQELTMAGLNVERVLQTGVADPNVVVGRVLEVTKHPCTKAASMSLVDSEDGVLRPRVIEAVKYWTVTKQEVQVVDTLRSKSEVVGRGCQEVTDHPGHVFLD